MNTTTYALFSSPEMAERAAGALLDHGIRAENISVVFPEGYSSIRGYGATDGEFDRPIDAKDIHDVAERGITTTTMGDAAVGAAKGAGVGLAAGTVAALASVFVPGVGLVLGAGALAAAIAGAAGATAAGAIAGGVTGFLKDQGVPQEAIAEYDSRIRAGEAFIMVNPTDEEIDTHEIHNILVKYSGRPTRYPAVAPELQSTGSIL